MVKEIVYTGHAENCLDERFISRQDVENVLRSETREAAYSGKKKAVRGTNGEEIEAILKPEDNVTVVTVYCR
jgi:hypothetical protein